MGDIRIVVSGAGKMGRQVATAVAAEPGMTPVGFIDGLATAPNVDGLKVYREVGPALYEERPEVVIDFSNAAWTPGMAREALECGARLVIGTTGLPAEFLSWLESETRAKGLGAVVAPNYAIGAVLMMHFAKQAAPFFENAEIIELHHDQKVDSPSGTAKTTAEMMRAARGKDFQRTVSEVEPLPGARGAESGGVTIHSVRLPGLVAHQEVILGGLGQTLTIRHDTTGRDSFMPGVLMAVREVMKLDHLVMGLDSLLGLR